MTAVPQPDSKTLSAVFDKLIDLVHESKQALWFVPSARLHTALDALKNFLEAQAALIDEAELQAGGRPASFVTPTGRPLRNIIGIAGGDPAALVKVLVADLAAVREDVVQAAATTEEWQSLLSELAIGLDRHVAELRSCIVS